MELSNTKDASIYLLLLWLLFPSLSLLVTVSGITGQCQRNKDPFRQDTCPGDKKANEFLELRIQAENNSYVMYSKSDNARHHITRGYYTGNHSLLYYPWRSKLHQTLVEFLVEEKLTSVVDVGGGAGNVTRLLMSNGIFASCYDGNPDAQEISNGTCATLDFTKHINIPKYEFATSLFVGYYIHPKYQDVFARNLYSISSKGLVIIWGRGYMEHADRYEKSQKELVSFFEKFGFKFHKIKTSRLQTQQCEYCQQFLVFMKI